MSDRDVFGADNLARVEHDLPRHDPKEGRLSDAVSPNESDPGAGRDVPRHVAEERPWPIALLDIDKVKHCRPLPHSQPMAKV